ncbi:hypothetical protein SAMN04488550_4346 [Gordonia malaquae]|uniref:AbiEi antitoxin C-terminal domain-containing protein n=1 Tax=Gordonia malaquae NBRC 108250 TaxID=1223542 RepID=M3VAX9_GORML|nr:hypothetical protein [Gordonia malaquae]GAC79293.1 hypothetical protein GM1_008_00550 [Gordonia malaquae NBRC 108250]SEE34744.1 hypothetical protein SAMN04488550_4346 [Gordonia malaquae]
MGDIDATYRLNMLIREQDGVLTRAQVLECGLDSGFVRQKLRRREWVVAVRGVYVTHTGPLSWRQRAWVAVLDASPSVLSHESALQAVQGGGSLPIHILVDVHRSVTKRKGVVVHYRADAAAVSMYNMHPPRIRLEEAIIDLAASAKSEAAVIARLSDAVQARLTTADRLLAALEARPRIARSAFLRDVLIDVRDGSLSVLEHGYLTRVERPHGLPKPTRQAETRSGRRGLRDVLYEEFGLIVELDGRTFHDTATGHDADLERDLDAAVWERRETLRVGYGQAFDRACTTAQKVGLVLNRLGWLDVPHPCRSKNCSIRQL